MVYFVGAGCGAADLITLRGKKLLEKADLIIYAGSLVNPELLSYAKKDCRFLDSAKLTLDEVMDAVLEAEAAQKTIVRLHSGEPSLYGAVREQMDELDERGIRYESCPGVTACFGAAASLNMEFTLPDVSQSLVITRMAGKTAVPDAESIESFAAHHASMAVYLSSGMTQELSRRLIAGGYSPETPAAIVYKASWPDEKTFVCTVGSLPEVAAANGITKTAVILVGDCVAHSGCAAGGTGFGSGATSCVRFDSGAAGGSGFGSGAGDTNARGYSKSRLYAPDFETEFRKKKQGGDVCSDGDLGCARGELECTGELGNASGKRVNKLKHRTDDPSGALFGGQRSSIVYVCSFTDSGRALEKKITSLFDNVTWISRTSDCAGTNFCDADDCNDAGDCVGADSCGTENVPSVRDFAEKAFSKHIPLVFIGAAGIATRISADFIKDKFYDSPVVVIDERGQFVIPLLSGHMGGANELAQLIASRIGAVPVITTASDVAKKFAVDVFARRNGFSIVNREEVKHVTGKLLRGEKIRVWVHPDFALAEDSIPEELVVVRGAAQSCDASPLDSTMPAATGCAAPETAQQLNSAAAISTVSDTAQPPDDVDIVILADNAQEARFATGAPCESDAPCEQNAVRASNDSASNASAPDSNGRTRRVVLVPKLYCVGMGCKKDKRFEELLQFFEESVPEEVRGNICAIASIDLKKAEKGLLELAQYLHVPFVTYTAQQLAQVPGEFSESDFVREQTGVSNVCERATVMCAGDAGSLVLKKTARNGITVAIAKRKPKIVTWRTELEQ
jgi:precorrin-4/cobalt-precorrin-4 C11-methyltransferase